mmetsp:Transcript_36714/g.80288  ORF Transcript_36714/g.80288 Transcript_36714/m.80288 type:complete len:946 (+) Transcript_36714:133-2970(+)
MLHARRSAQQQLGCLYSSGGLRRRRLGDTTLTCTRRAAATAAARGVVSSSSSSGIATSRAGYAQNNVHNDSLSTNLRRCRYHHEVDSRTACSSASSWCRSPAAATRASRPIARQYSTIPLHVLPKTATATAAATCTAAYDAIRSFTTSSTTTSNGNRSRPASSHRANYMLYNGPQSTLPRLDLYDDPSLAKLSPVQIARKVIDIPVGKLNPADVTHGLIFIIKDCCKVQTDEGMDAARGLLRRCLDEKRHINTALLRELEQRAVDRASGGGADIDIDDDDDSIGASGWSEPLIISQLPFHILAHGWAKMCGRGRYRDGPSKVSDIMGWMATEDEYDRQVWDSLEELLPPPRHGSDSGSSNRDSCQPTTASYNTLLTAYVYASKQNRLAGRAAEDVLKRMMQLNQERGWHTKPNTKSYGLAISVHARSDRYKSARFAEYVLNDMKARHETERERYENEVGRPYDVRHPSNNAWQIVTPDVVAYTNVISAYANADAKGYAQRAEEILFDMMDNRDRFGIRPDSQAFATAIRAWANAARRMGNPKARFEAAERAEGLLRLMEELAVEEEQQTSAATSSGEGVVGNGNANILKNEVVDEWDEEEQDTIGSNSPLAPTTKTYNAVLAAWAKSDIKEAAPRAEALLHKMLASVIAPISDEDAEGEGGGEVEDSVGKTGANSLVPPPDRYSFNITIGAYARSFDNGAAEKGEDLFDMMYELYHSGRLGEDIKPKADTYSSVINAWARSRGKPGQTANARRLLDTMLGKFRGGEEDMAPNVLAYTAVLNAAVNEAMKEKSDLWETDSYDNANEEGTDKPFDDDSPYSIAMRTYHEMKVDTHGVNVRPDHITFATMIKVIASHTSESSTERRSMLETVFDDACASGRVSSAVIRELRVGCPTVDLLERLLRSRDLAASKKSIYSELPRQWTKNVNVDQRRHKVNTGDMKKKEAI